MSKSEKLCGLSWKKTPGAFEMLEMAAISEDEPKFADITALGTSRGLSDHLNATELKLRWKALVDRLKGYRREKVLFKHKPIWVPIIELSVPTGGKAILKYEKGSSKEIGPELKIFGLGFGGGGKFSFSESIEFSASNVGKSFQVLMFATGTQYRSSDGSTEIRLDWDCEGDGDAQKIEDRSLAQEIEDLESLDSLSWKIVKKINLSSSQDVGQYTWQYKTTEKAFWNVGLKLSTTPLPGIGVDLNLPLSFERSEMFDVTFEMPYGHDYILFHRIGETPLVPTCARISSGSI